MMSSINLHNYEAWFLDYSEGRLSAVEVEQLSAFLEAHPELRAELDEFENVSLRDIPNTLSDWSDLKKPNLQDLKENIDKREELYFNAVEGILNPHEQRMLTALLRIPAFVNEYALWQKTRLLPSSESINRDLLYQFGLDRAVDESNFESYLIALGEGLLNDKQHHALADFAERYPDKLNAMAMAGKLRLQAPAGIFYPDKNKLYRREQRRILPLWLYRAAAVLLLAALGTYLWFGLQDTDRQSTAPLAEKVQAAVKVDSEADSSAVPIEEGTPVESGTGNTLSKEAPLMEWEVREPDDVLVTETYVKSAQGNEALEVVAAADNVAQASLMQPIDPIAHHSIDIQSYSDGLAYISFENATIPQADRNHEPQQAIAKEDASLQAKHITSEFYQSIPEYAVSALARQLSIEEQEHDRMALALARKVTERAGEVLDTEFKKDVGSDSENLSYMLRIRGFSLSHSRSK